ncbi:MAG: hypothetical protein ABIF85_07465 [Nanoarchaeota archaeon]|nr:hypothetical protein [Nanoarchaeota archaeon]MCG2724094.1 hypothetical protein [archaeon]
MSNSTAPVIIFDNSVKERIIKALGYAKNKKSELVDSEGKTITSQNFESISDSEFAGVLIGSKIPLKNKESELVGYFIRNGN